MACPPQASKLPAAVDQGWEALGGGPADLVFPDEFLGRWDVESVLTSVELPLGPEFVPDMQVHFACCAAALGCYDPPTFCLCVGCS